MIGDEMAYPKVLRAHIGRLIGADPQADIPVRQIVAEGAREISCVLRRPRRCAAWRRTQQMLKFWRADCWESKMCWALANPDDTSECIAMTIGVTEGVISLDQVQEHMAKRGKVAEMIHRVMKSIGHLFGGELGKSTLGGPRL